jgi:hypothetical protein
MTRDVNNTPEMLRKLAADIEAGMYGAVYCAAVVLEAAELPTFGYGPTGESAQNVSDLFAMAHAKLVRERLNYIESLEP